MNQLKPRIFNCDNCKFSEHLVYTNNPFDDTTTGALSKGEWVIRHTNEGKKIYLCPTCKYKDEVGSLINELRKPVVALRKNIIEILKTANRLIDEGVISRQDLDLLRGIIRYETLNILGGNRRKGRRHNAS